MAEFETDRELVASLFERMMAHDHPGTLAMFSDDAVVSDPHYPIQTMVGRAAIARGLAWSMKALTRPSFEIQRAWGEAGSGVVEVRTEHVIKGGIEVDFQQIFLFETRAGKITRLRAFVPYRQPGIGGLFPRIAGLWFRLTRG